MIRVLPYDSHALLIVELPPMIPPALKKGVTVTLCDKATTMHSTKYRRNPEAAVYDLQGVMHSDPLQVKYSNYLWVPYVPDQDNCPCKGELSLQTKMPLASGCETSEMCRLEKKAQADRHFHHKLLPASAT